MANGNWHWQESGTAWKGVGIYHVTLTVPSREPLLGKLVIPAGNNSDGIVLCKGVAYLLNNHHQDGKGQGAIERVQDVAAIRRSAAVTAGGGIFIETIPKKVGPGLYNLPIL